jgi:hypothetical protein
MLTTSLLFWLEDWGGHEAASIQEYRREIRHCPEAEKGWHDCFRPPDKGPAVNA